MINSTSHYLFYVSMAQQMFLPPTPSKYMTLTKGGKRDTFYTQSRRLSIQDL